MDAYRVSFEVYIGAQSKGRINIHLTTGTGVTAPVATLEPANRLPLPRLASHPYRLYPLVDQIADKVCAVMELHDGRPSSREKDLVDLAVIARTQRVDKTALSHAIEVESRRRRMHPITGFDVPRSWGAAYAKMAKRVPHLDGYATAADAAELVAAFVCPGSTEASNSQTWNPEALAWE